MKWLTFIFPQKTDTFFRNLLGSIKTQISRRNKFPVKFIALTRFINMWELHKMGKGSDIHGQPEIYSNEHLGCRFKWMLKIEQTHKKGSPQSQSPVNGSKWFRNTKCDFDLREYKKNLLEMSMNVRRKPYDCKSLWQRIRFSKC